MAQPAAGSAVGITGRTMPWACGWGGGVGVGGSGQLEGRVGGGWGVGRGGNDDTSRLMNETGGLGSRRKGADGAPHGVWQWMA